MKVALVDGDGPAPDTIIPLRLPVGLFGAIATEIVDATPRPAIESGFAISMVVLSSVFFVQEEVIVLNNTAAKSINIKCFIWGFNICRLVKKVVILLRKYTQNLS